MGFVMSLIVQTAGQAWFAANSYWGGNEGWQNEIAIWNFGMVFVLVGVLRESKPQNTEEAMAEETDIFLGLARQGEKAAHVIPGLFALSLLFAANHIHAIMQPVEVGETDERKIQRLSNWAGAIMNTFAVLLGLSYFASELSHAVDYQVEMRSKRTV